MSDFNKYIVRYQYTYNSEYDGRKKPVYEDDTEEQYFDSIELARSFVEIRSRPNMWDKNTKNHSFKIYALNPTLVEEVA